MILLIDSYDSFSYNLYQLIGEIEPDIRVIRNDELTVEEIEKMNPARIILSPGPGRPEDAGILMETVQKREKKFLSWASVWGIRRSARPSGRPWGMRNA